MKHLCTYLLAWIWIFGLAVTTAYGEDLRTGADRTEAYLPLLKGKRITLVVNQTSRIGETHLLDTLCALGIRPVQILAPEHGFRGTADAGKTVRNGKDARTGVPIYSLYGKNKKPQPEQLQRTDWVVFDIQDVGARFYTYISTLYYVMQACAEQHKPLLLLDRPNPCDYIDGPVLKNGYKSFVGMFPIPVLHGCTIGELARMMNGEGWLGNGLRCELTVVPVSGWQHGQPYSLPVKPSPNLPNDQAIALYPSLCPFEGTPVSVGRGTANPFQVVGSPVTRDFPYSFVPKPTAGSDKNPLQNGKTCYGLDLRQTTPPAGFSLEYVLRFYQAYRKAGQGDKFFSRSRFFDLLMGTDQVRLDILKGKDETGIRSAWQADLDKYRTLRKKYLLYPEPASSVSGQ